jgi:hypothetical protein
VSDPTIVELIPGWDAALTYDVLASDDGGPVFVGREDLLGPLVNAIGQPDRRGTYLVSGYRGAGKTSLVIEAARRAKPKLTACDHKLLPLVLNVSEVSASLETAEATELPKLGIDARKLLTALLRALRNGLPDDDEVSGMVRRAYAKAEASQYSETAAQKAEAARMVKAETSVSAATPNALKALAAVAGVGVASVGVGAWLGTVAGVLVGLAGVAAISFTASRTTSSSTADSSVASTELVFDNSLHQVESDLKDILAALDREKWRTLFVLEELDKVEDQQGQQLDAVIRYFKNLFTQAPALFFFLTDKEYFDIIGANIAAARRKRSYAVEHTFFTHRVFVSRPSLDECLAYFFEVLVGSDARAAVEHIRTTRSERTLPLSEMTPIERCLRVMLFQSQNHLFDLKNEMRRFLSVDDSGSRLVFDENSMPEQEQAVAALQFVLEQKAALYRFGGGRDYANEVLRNCLSEVFAELGSDEPWRVGEVPGDLRAAERSRIAEAVASLIGDLERGGAIERRGEDYVWQPVLAFEPSPMLETHEQELKAELERSARICEQFVGDGPLARVDGAEPMARELLDEYGGLEQRVNQGSVTVEESARLRTSVRAGLTPLLDRAHAAHRERLAALGWALQGEDGNFLASRPGATGGVRLVYTRPVMAGLAVAQGEQAVAVIVVEDDPGDSRLEELRLLFAQAAPRVLVICVPLAEGMERPEAWWGERTVDELVLARIWLAQAELPPAIAGDGEAWLHEGTQTTRYDTLADALAAWLAGAEPLLGAPPDGGADDDRLVRALAELAPGSARPVLGQDARVWLRPPIADADNEALRRLIDAGRVVTFVGHPMVVPTARSIVTLAVPTQRVSVVVRASDTPAAIRAIGEFVEPRDAGHAVKLLEQAADAGDARAIARLVARGDAPRERLLQTGDWPVIVMAAEALPDGEELLQSGVDAGNPLAMAALLRRRPGDELADKLIATRDWDVVRQAADDSELGRRLLAAAADAGDADALKRLVVAGVESRDADLIAAADALTLWQTAEELDAGGDEARGLRFHRAAAIKGDVDSMREVLVRGEEEESRENQEQLRKRQDWYRLRQAADRLDGERAAELRALIDG